MYSDVPDRTNPTAVFSSSGASVSAHRHSFTVVYKRRYVALSFAQHVVKCIHHTSFSEVSL